VAERIENLGLKSELRTWVVNSSHRKEAGEARNQIHDRKSTVAARGGNRSEKSRTNEPHRRSHNETNQKKKV
jgi:hypothetical protein